MTFPGCISLQLQAHPSKCLTLVNEACITHKIFALAGTSTWACWLVVGAMPWHFKRRAYILLWNVFGWRQINLRQWLLPRNICLDMHLHLSDSPRFSENVYSDGCACCSIVRQNFEVEWAELTKMVHLDQWHSQLLFLETDGVRPVNACLHSSVYVAI